MGDKAIFLAYLPPIQSAIKISGNGDGARVQFDIPETSMAGFIAVMGMRECQLQITVEVIEKAESKAYQRLG